MTQANSTPTWEVLSAVKFLGENVGLKMGSDGTGMRPSMCHFDSDSGGPDLRVVQN